MFTRPFWFLCAGSALFMSSFSMIIPELPEYLRRMGGEQYIGYIIGLFTLSAAFSRPLSGLLTDRVGRLPIMIFGTLVTVFCGVSYIFVQSIALFLMLRFIHGMSTGFRPTASTTYLTDIVPLGKRGEAMGYLGIAGSTGMAAGPALGSILKEEFSFDVMFISSSIMGLIALILTLQLKETLSAAQKASAKERKWFEVFEPAAIPAALVMLFDTFSFGVILTVVPDMMAHLGLKYKGLFNAVMVVSSIAVRWIAGKASDRYGRLPLLRIGTLILLVSLLTMAFADSIPAAMTGAILFGLALGTTRPAIFAWTADLAPPDRIGTSLSTMLLALEIGIGSGAFISGAIYANEIENLKSVFLLATLVAFVGLIVVLLYGHKYRKRTV
jgi:MFS family permease